MDNNVGLSGAILEMNFDDLAKGGKATTEVSGHTFTIIDDVGYCPIPLYNEKGVKFYPKAITVMDSYGNIFVHFNGTGDGFWKENCAAAGGEASDVQEWALNYFNRTIENINKEYSIGNLYVTGHSQGGNNAQFVTIRSPYADYITNCVSLNGPGFSNQFINDSINLFGEAHYERQRNKIHGIYTENDFASTYAQNDIIPENHINFIRQSKQDEVEKPNDNLLFRFHAVEYMLHKDSNNNYILNKEAESSAFRELLKKLSSVIYKQNNDVESRYLIGILLGGIAEKFSGDEYPGNLSIQEFEYLKNRLVPALVTTLNDNLDLLSPALQSVGLSQQAADSIAALVGHINTYPIITRELILKSILGLVKYENGQFGINWWNVPGVVLSAWPVIIETALTHPADILKLLQELGVVEAIGNWIKENPWQFIGICIGAIILSPILIPLAKILVTIATAFVIAGLLADAVIRIVQGLVWLGEKIINAIVSIFNAIKDVINAFSQWLRNTFNAGVRYVNSNPYFKVDTMKLRNYAMRINNVNVRLNRLDGDLRGLYWQVGLLDIWDIMVANLLTSGSPTLIQIKSYMNNAADRIETSDNKARGSMGG